jgi:hypothetical protein
MQWNAKANDAMQKHDFISTHTSPRKGVRAATTLLISTCVAVPVLTPPIWLWFLQMHIDGKSANANVVMFIHHIPQNSYFKEQYYKL